MSFTNDLRVIRDLTSALYEGTTLNDGSVMTAEKCVFERYSDGVYVMLFDFTGDMFFQNKITSLLESTVSELCGALGVSTTMVDLTN